MVDIIAATKPVIAKTRTMFVLIVSEKMFSFLIPPALMRIWKIKAPSTGLFQKVHHVSAQNSAILLVMEQRFVDDFSGNRSYIHALLFLIRAVMTGLIVHKTASKTFSIAAPAGLPAVGYPSARELIELQRVTYSEICLKVYTEYASFIHGLCP
jgi:hypothetical protein